MLPEIGPGRLLAALTDWIEPIYGIREARSIASMILERKLGLNTRDVLRNRPYLLTNENISEINEILIRLADHEPVQYILGEAFFFDRWFIVNSSVLIPRSETEELCDIVIRENRSGSLRVLDVGTGSGCIITILSLHMHLSYAEAWDISPEALRVAAENALRYQVKITFKEKDILTFTGSEERYDILVSNPPYVARDEADKMQRNVLDYEPDHAIFADDDPLKFYTSLAANRENLLKPGGSLYLEINESKGKEIRHLLENSGFSEVRIIQDLHGKDRFAAAKS